MRGQADPWEMRVLLEGLKRHWAVSCKGRNQDEKKSISIDMEGATIKEEGAQALKRGLMRTHFYIGTIFYLYPACGHELLQVL